MDLPTSAWRDAAWREGSNTALGSRFAVVRVRPASEDRKRMTPADTEWLLVEWRQDEPEPTKYWLSTLPEDTALEPLVDTANMRWRFERDYETSKAKSVLLISRGEAGGDSIITPRYASQPTIS